MRTKGEAAKEYDVGEAAKEYDGVRRLQSVSGL